ncbi:MBL fold metallo-hydrolase [Gluconobacter sp. OJB]|uniref:ComEC/Rec2 family competence protein n=1 Tax=Gluconobacter sp. OJB TaxID=3145196 RepID=UPI0031F8F6F1
MDIHHIDTARGNATLIVAPDGTSILVDCGASAESFETSSPTRPNTTKRAGQWVAEYLKANGVSTLDYCVATHVHPDHVGDVTADSPWNADRSYRLTGISDVDAVVPIRRFVDRCAAFPRVAPSEYAPPDMPFAKNWRAFLASKQREGRVIEAPAVGLDEQIRLGQSAAGFPAFSLRFIGANGYVWDRDHNRVRYVFAEGRSDQDRGVRPDENALSMAFRLEYGNFSYYSGGDLICDTRGGKYPWLDTETPVARATGKVDVAVANHHAYFDACGEGFTRNLDAQAYVAFSWDVGHPDPAPLQRLLNGWPGEKIKDVFLTGTQPCAELVSRRFMKLVKSKQGHVVVRVDKNGDKFRIFVIDSGYATSNIISYRSDYFRVNISASDRI